MATTRDADSKSWKAFMKLRRKAAERRYVAARKRYEEFLDAVEAQRVPFRFFDLFCGAGGSSTGAIEALKILGRAYIGKAVNHWPPAIATHQANHPEVQHFLTGIDDVDLTLEEVIDLLIASPVCTHFSSARGGKPINPQLRSTANCVIRYLKKLKPKWLFMENVPEWMTFGPEQFKRHKDTGERLWMVRERKLTKKGKPSKSKNPFKWVEKRASEVFISPHLRKGRGEHFGAYKKRLERFGIMPAYKANKAKKGRYAQRWMRKVRRMGFSLSPIIDISANNGDPTTRKRLYMLGANLSWGLEVVSANPTHSDPKAKGGLKPGTLPWPTARDHVIDWGIRGTSIRDRKDGMALNTLRRIWTGFIKQLEEKGINAELLTKDGNVFFKFATKADFKEAFSGKYMVRLNGTTKAHIESSNCGIDNPIPGMVGGGQHYALVEPVFIETAHGNERPTDNDRRVHSTDKPLGGITGSQNMGLAEPNLIQVCHDGADESRVYSIDETPPSNQGNRGELALVQPQVVQVIHTGYDESRIREMDEPILPLTASSGVGLVEPMIIPQHTSNAPFKVGDKPAPVFTTTSRGVGLAEAYIIPQQSNPLPHKTDQPVGALTADGSGPKLIEPEITPVTRKGSSSALNPKFTCSTCEGLYETFHERCPACLQPALVPILDLDAYLVPNFGEREGQTPRTHGIGAPIPAPTGHGAGGLVEPVIISKHGGPGNTARPVSGPIFAPDTAGAGSLVEPCIIRYNGESNDESIDSPLSPSCTEPKHYLLTSHIQAIDNASDKNGTRSTGKPLPVVIADDQRLAKVDGVLTPAAADSRGSNLKIAEPMVLPQGGGSDAQPDTKPVSTIATDGALALVDPSLSLFDSTTGPTKNGPTTVPVELTKTKPRHALVEPILLEIEGEHYLLDFLFRMLEVHELAAGMGFPKDYIFVGSKSDRIKLIGNAVSKNTARNHILAMITQRPDVGPLIEAWIADQTLELLAA